MAGEAPWGYQHYQAREPVIMADRGVQRYSSEHVTPILPFDSPVWSNTKAEAGRIWEIEDGRYQPQKYRIPADCYVPLGGQTDNMAGMLRFGDTVYLGRMHTHQQFRAAGMTDIELDYRRHNYTDTLEVQKGEYTLHYKLNARDGRPVLSTDISRFVMSQGAARRTSRGVEYASTYMLPNFDAAVRAAAARPESMLHAEGHIVRLVPDESDDEIRRPMQRWNLVLPYDVPGLQESGQTEWFRSRTAVADLIAHPATAQAVQVLDRATWGIIDESFEYVNGGRRKELIKGIAGAAGALILVALAGRALEDWGDGDIGGGTTEGAIDAAVEELYSTPIGQAADAAQTLGEQHADPHFSGSVRARDESIGATVTIKLPTAGSWTKDSRGRDVWVGSDGSMTVYD